MTRVLLVGVLGCVGGDSLPALSPPQANVEVWVDDAKVGSGEPVLVTIQTTGAEGWTFGTVVPFADDLETSLVDESGPVAAGERLVTTRRYALSGPDGSYVIATTEAEATGPQGQSRTFESSPMFVDIGVDGPTGGPMEGFVDAPMVEPLPWDRIAVFAAVCMALIGAITWWWRRRGQRVPVLPPPVPPHILAQGAWADARATIRDEHELAVCLSVVLRDYLESRTGIPASKATTSEIWAALAAAGVDGVPLDDALKGRIAQILDATDRLKFARMGGGEEFFRQLDEHFAVIIRATRPIEQGPEADA